MIELESTEDICLKMMVSEAKNIKGRTNMEVNVIEYLFADLKIYQLLLSISASAGSPRPIWLR